MAIHLLYTHHEYTCAVDAAAISQTNKRKAFMTIIRLVIREIILNARYYKCITRILFTMYVSKNSAEY